MSRGNRGIRKPPDIALMMECEDEELSDWQLSAQARLEQEYNSANQKVETLKKTYDVIDKGDDIIILQPPESAVQGTVPALTPVPSLTAAAPQNAFTVNSSPSVGAPAPQKQTGSIVQPVQGSVIVNNSQQVRPGGTYQLVMDPRIGLIVGTAVSTTSLTSSAPVLAAKTTAKTTPMVQVSTAVQQPVAQTRTQAGRPTAIKPAAPTVVIPSAPVQSKTTGAGNARTTVIKARTPTATAETPVSSARIPNTQATNQVQTKTYPASSSNAGRIAPKPPKSVQTVDLTSDDTADSREVTFNKLSGKTFPSLVVVARPFLKIRDMPPSVVSQERAALDSKVKNVLVYSPTKFTEWLIQQGLVRSEQFCTSHVTSDFSPVRLKLGMYSDVSKFPYSGGYVWISECCPQRFVSVFSGSIFEGAPHPPTVLLKLMYHWACQTNVQNVVQWVKVDNFYVKNFFTNMRSVCTAAIHDKFEKLGGPNKKIEVGVISLGTTSQDGHMRQVKVEVLGVMDPDKKYIRLRAVEPLPDAERNYKRRFAKILEPMDAWVDKESLLVTDFTVDKGTLISMGFKTVIQVQSADPQSSASQTTNQAIMDYLRRIVPRMFQNTLSLLSRQIIQQFLDELTWRERWGPTASQAFENIIALMAEQTKHETGDTLLQRLSKIATNPFKNWQYSREKASTNTSGMTNGNAAASNSTARAAPQSTVVSLQPQKRNRKRAPADASAGSEPKKLQVTPQEMRLLETFYYGTLDGDQTLIDKQTKAAIDTRCSVCRRNFTNNILLMKHLIMHAQNDNSFNTELGDLTQCKYCLRNFDTPYNMQTHVEEIHLKSNNSLVCRICEESFRDRGSLINHMHRMHVCMELPYSCGICNFRSSMHRTLIDHFYEVHNGTEKLQCPFCLKIVAVSSKGKKLTNNIYFFFNHIQKHQRKSIVKKCNKCVLWFIHKGILKEHQIKDHSSFKGQPGVKPIEIPVGIDTVMMPPPSDKSRALQPKIGVGASVKPRYAYTVVSYNSLTVNGGKGLSCCECEGDLKEEEHFSGYLCCSRCRFATCCTKAMHEHVVVFHESKTPQFHLGKVIRLKKELYCVCGFKSKSGNRLAKHLAKCERKSAYPSMARAKASTIQSQSASFPPLVTLDDNDDVHEDPSDQWLKAFVPRKDDEPKDVEKKSAAPPSNDQPSMLNILGLVRKASTDESSCEKVPSDTEDSKDAKESTHSEEEQHAKDDKKPGAAALSENEKEDKPAEDSVMETEDENEKSAADGDSGADSGDVIDENKGEDLESVCESITDETATKDSADIVSKENSNKADESGMDVEGVSKEIDKDDDDDDEAETEAKSKSEDALSPDPISTLDTEKEKDETEVEEMETSENSAGKTMENETESLESNKQETAMETECAEEMKEASENSPGKTIEADNGPETSKQETAIETEGTAEKHDAEEAKEAGDEEMQVDDEEGDKGKVELSAKDDTKTTGVAETKADETGTNAEVTAE